MDDLGSKGSYKTLASSWGALDESYSLGQCQLEGIQLTSIENEGFVPSYKGTDILSIADSLEGTDNKVVGNGRVDRGLALDDLLFQRNRGHLLQAFQNGFVGKEGSRYLYHQRIGK